MPRLFARRAVSDPSSRMSVTVQRSPLRTHPRVVWSRRSFFLVMIVSPIPARASPWRATSRRAFTVPSRMRSARAR